MHPQYGQMTTFYGIRLHAFRTDDAVEKTGTFTGEGISEVEGLTCSI